MVEAIKKVKKANAFESEQNLQRGQYVNTSANHLTERIITYELLVAFSEKLTCNEDVSKITQSFY